MSVKGGVVERDANNEPLRIVCVQSDISERKRAEKLKDEFISIVSHELRTPLTSINGSLGLLAGQMRDKLDSDTLSLVGIAGRNSERLILLVNNSWMCRSYRLKASRWS